MNTTQVTFDLPAEIVESARNAGILENKRIARLLQAEIERQRDLDQFFALLDKLHSDPNRITPEEIDEEIRQYRLEKRLAREQAKSLEPVP